MTSGAAYLVLAWVACGVVGYVIGKQFKQEAWGILLGMILPAVGILAWQLSRV